MKIESAAAQNNHIFPKKRKRRAKEKRQEMLISWRFFDRREWDLNP